MSSSSIQKAGSREWAALAVLALPTLLVSFDLFVLLLALPHVTKDLNASSTQQLWISDIYGFVLVGFLLTMGGLGDRIGRRKLLLIGATAFGVISVVCARSTSPGMLIAARACLGAAGATLTPSTLALISNIFRDAKQRTIAISIWGGMWTLGAIIGPIIGGILLDHFWWGSVFLLGVPAMVILLIAGPILLPESRNRDAGRLDLISVVLSLCAVLPIIYGIKQLAANGWQPLPIVAIVVGALIAFAFLRRQRGLADPLLDSRLFANGSFSTALGGLLCYNFIGGGTMLFLTQYYQLVAGMSPLKGALAMVPGMAAGTVSFALTPMLASRFRPAYVIACGLAGAVATLLVFTQVNPDSAGTLTLIIGFAVFSLLGVPLVALGTNLVVGSAPPEKAGTAGSLTQLSNEFGSTLGIALIGTVGFTVYRAVMAHAVPATVPAPVARAARGSLAQTVSSTGGLPRSISGPLLDQAHHAFTDGLHTICAVSAFLLAGIAILVAVKLRHVPPIGSQSAAEGQDEPAAPGTSETLVEDPAGKSSSRAA